MPLDDPQDPLPSPRPAASPRQRAALIHRIRTLMEFWGITAHELQRHKAAPARPAPEGPAKYRHPSSGDTWDGRGPQPDWLRLALLKEGFTVEQLRQAALSASECPTQAEGDAPSAESHCP